MSFPDLQSSAIFATAAYLILACCYLAWVFVSKQALVPRTPGYAIRLLLRLACVVVASWIVLETLSDIHVRAAIVALLVLVAIFSMADEFALAFVATLAHQFVLGFPMRHELFLQPDQSAIGPTAKAPDDRIGQVGTTTSPLRPSGTVEIDGKEHSAASEDGRFIDPGSNVIVRDTQGSTLLVEEIEQPHI